MSEIGYQTFIKEQKAKLVAYEKQINDLKVENKRIQEELQQAKEYIYQLENQIGYITGGEVQ